MRESDKEALRKEFDTLTENVTIEKATYLGARQDPENTEFSNQVFDFLVSKLEEKDSAIHASERFRAQDAMSHINEANELRAKLEAARKVMQCTQLVEEIPVFMCATTCAQLPNCKFKQQ